LQGPFHALLNAFRKISCALLGRVFLISSGRSSVLFHGIKGEWSIMVYKGRLGLGVNWRRFMGIWERGIVGQFSVAIIVV